MKSHVAWIGIRMIICDSFRNAIWRFPFNVRNPMGYLIASVFQLTKLTFTLFLVANILTFGIGCYLIGITATKEIKNTLQIADKKLRLKKERPLAMKRFTDLIKWHSIIKQLSKSTFTNSLKAFNAKVNNIYWNTLFPFTRCRIKLHMLDICHAWCFVSETWSIIIFISKITLCGWAFFSLSLDCSMIFLNCSKIYL